MAAYPTERELRITERAAETSLALPMGPALEESEAADVIGVIARCLAAA
jgi:dTDP-4-amino-4,6-dideoxygalactose transaminase